MTEAVTNTAPLAPHTTVGAVLREWRAKRRMSQLELALDAEISARHLSFVESGRSSPSRDLLLKLAERLAMPLRARNRLMLSAGYAPAYAETVFNAPDMSGIRATVGAILDGHDPFPAIAIDSRWTLVQANKAAGALFEGINPEMLTPPLNVLRLSLHPQGLATRIVNLAEWRQHVLERLRVQIEGSDDPFLSELFRELFAYPVPADLNAPSLHSLLAVPLELRMPGSDQILRFMSTTTVFSTATSVTLAELALECFYPADAETRSALMQYE
ncbi:helix-turn-helix transcriptional regulator [Rhizobium sp. CG4]|jgi:transcriptional regulator with XRE-family HTH domain|uniref:helix-turn-helix domain-containing protein n=1 Tax=Rhizobium sp. CG4 TaxID=2726075 RepID=UPI002034850D|nr:helix-turn-helix transcriptional regulator [Rhizobium sp. CG4]MCM2458556.1 helix-turn-helix transcriptional regulator [Rhizobium sp. CG4]